MTSRRGLLSCLALLFPSVAFAVFQNDFSAYPKGAQQCLYTASNNSGCNGSDVKTMNACLCGNTGNFVLSTASCVGSSSPADVNQVFLDLLVNCAGSNTPMKITQSQFNAAASGTTSKPGSTTTAATTGPTQTPDLTTITTNIGGQPVTVTITRPTGQPTGTPGNSTENNTSGGLSTGAKVGIAAGSVAAIGIVGVGAFFLLRRRRANRSSREESHAMLPQAPGAYPPSEYAQYGVPPTGGAYNHQDWKGDNKPPAWMAPSTSPSPAPSQGKIWAHSPQQPWDATQNNWSHQQQQPQYAELAQPPPASQHSVYELDSSATLTPGRPLSHISEMPASPAGVSTYQSSNNRHSGNNWNR
jgi:hypothetical protein